MSRFIIRLESYCHNCGGRGVPCHTTSPQRMIPPPIKRSRILVSGSVVIVILVKLYNKICGCGACGCSYPAGKFLCADILRLEQKVALLSSTCGFSESSFLKQFCALPERRTFFLLALASKGLVLHSC
jgi:hypothetical protein